ncbi:hypothetical protein D1AOALGA4SA_8983 [Olavius algarvensis Delta 1 endosymbiont]|nr:hypothetical protein D1AOALGA4SA_8983 [Olavius algarvensis Delta 1 endosymbiont]
MMANNLIRIPDEYRKHVSDRKWRKWEKIVSLFMENRLDDLALNHRTGARGRIFTALSLEIFNKLQIPYKSEPIFYHIEPNQWYIEFAKQHAIKLRTHDFYNPDLFLSDGTWVEVTLSENTAYQKLFRYGHQADNLLVLWLDKDEGYHKEICQKVRFPNAEIKSIECFNTLLEKLSSGPDIIRKLERLKKLKGTIL